MCGIVGMTSGRDVARATVERVGLMEYRGYDSYGLAAVADGTISLTKDVGSVGRALREGRFDHVRPAGLALGHTRWATHGGVTQPNAHPHLSYDGKVAIVHNGVIENHAEIRRTLEADGVRFASETDSEVAAHLIASHVARGATPVEAVTRATRALEGEYALGVVFTDDPQAVYGAKLKSPLAVCFDGEQAVLASDQMALAGVGDQVMFLSDGDVVRLTVDGAQVFTAGADGEPVGVSRDYLRLDGSQHAVDKGGYPHFMIKEIFETPTAATVALQVPAQRFSEIIPADSDRPVTLIGAGSAFYVAQIGQYLLAELAGIRAMALPSDEAEHLALLRPGDPLIAISQSGETFDTLEICRSGIAVGAVLTSISNVPNSTQERLATHRVQQGSGPEICVLSTKSIVSQVVLLARLALETGRANQHLTAARYAALQDSLARLPETLETFLAGDAAASIQALAKRYSHVEDWFFIGRGILYPVASESALKFKEVSYRHAEGMPAGFFKHGTISLIDENFYTVALLPSHHSDHARSAATLANVSEIAARGGPVIGIGPAGMNPDDLGNFVEYLALPYHGDNLADAVLQLVAGQLLAYFCALDLGREIDQPRSLAKSVTVR